MPEPLQDFKRFLIEFRGLSKWAVGGLAVPYVGSLLSISPPWPRAITTVTSLIELLTLIFAFQFLRSSARKKVSKVMLVAGALLLGLGIIYLIAYSQLVYETPVTHARFVKGLVCTADAKQLFPAKCPNLGMDELNTAEYDAERLWTLSSITYVRIGLIATWVCCFISLSVTIAAFILFQMKPRATSKPWKLPAANIEH